MREIRQFAADQASEFILGITILKCVTVVKNIIIFRYTNIIAQPLSCPIQLTLVRVVRNAQYPGMEVIRARYCAGDQDHFEPTRMLGSELRQGPVGRQCHLLELIPGFQWRNPDGDAVA